MSNKNTWGVDVEALNEATARLKAAAIDSWAVPVVEWLNRKLTR